MLIPEYAEVGVSVWKRKNLLRTQEFDVTSQLLDPFDVTIPIASRKQKVIRSSKHRIAHYLTTEWHAMRNATINPGRGSPSC